MVKGDIGRVQIVGAVLGAIVDTCPKIGAVVVDAGCTQLDLPAVGDTQPAAERADIANVVVADDDILDGDLNSVGRN